MRSDFFRFFVLFWFVSFSITLPSCLESSEKTYGDIVGVLYVSNYDADTITVDIPSYPPIVGDKIPVRIYGIDTPEIRGRCAKERELAKKAKELVREILTKAKTISLKNVGKDKYFRIIATVVADDINLGELLIKKGLAVEYFGGRKTKDWCK